jgi:hypothetical protein
VASRLHDNQGYWPHEGGTKWGGGGGGRRGAAFPSSRTTTALQTGQKAGWAAHFTKQKNIANTRYNTCGEWATHGWPPSGHAMTRSISWFAIKSPPPLPVAAFFVNAPAAVNVGVVSLSRPCGGFTVPIPGKYTYDSQHTLAQSKLTCTSAKPAQMHVCKASSNARLQSQLKCTSAKTAQMHVCKAGSLRYAVAAKAPSGKGTGKRRETKQQFCQLASATLRCRGTRPISVTTPASCNVTGTLHARYIKGTCTQQLLFQSSCTAR